MSEKYIRKNPKSFSIVKNSRTYARFTDMDDAILIRDELVKNNWNLEAIDGIYQIDDSYVLVKVIDEKIFILDRFPEKPDEKTIEKLVKEKLRNPNSSKYGLNITKVFDTYVIRKQIAGDEYIFGYYDRLEDAEFVRNFLMDNHWNVNAFAQIEYDADNDNFKVIEVIDDKVYVLNSYNDETSIDIIDSRRKFLNRISKHKFGLASHDYLSQLTDNISELEERFSIKADDEVWSFEDAENPLEDIIFNLTPFQKSVYDAVDDSTFEEIKKSLIRFKSGNFDTKIQKNLDELVDSGLISKNQNHYIKRSH